MKKRFTLRRVVYSSLTSIAIVVVYLGYIGPKIYQPSEGSEKIIIYSASWCPYCKKLKETLNKNGISYTEYDIEKSIIAQFEFRSLGGSGVPLSIIGEDVIYGYQPEVIQASLAKIGYK